MEKKPITDSEYTSNFAVGNTVVAGDRTVSPSMFPRHRNSGAHVVCQDDKL
jgi:hypothetical protein